MSKQKNLLWLIAALSVLFCFTLFFAGCGQAESPAPQAPAEEGEEPGEESPELEEVKVGMVGPLTGGAATYGISTRNGAQVAINQANENEEIPGVYLSFHPEDTEGDWSKAANAFSKIIEQDGVNVIIGAVLSSETEAGGPIAMDAGIPTISPSSTATGLTVGNPYLFRNCLSDEVQASQLAEYAVEELGLSRFAILYTNNDYGNALKDAFEETAGKLAEVVEVEAFMDNDENFRPQLTSIQQKNPEAIFIAGYYTEAAKIAQQAAEQGMEVQILGADGFYSPVLIELGEETVEGAIFTAGFHADDPDPTVQSFVEAYREQYNEEPDMFAAQAYDAARIVIEAMKNFGTDPESIRAGIAATEDFPGITGITSIDEEGDTIKEVLILQVENGTFQRIR
jgi:branched-chain amino acid transport system substrate-binding protein